MSQLLPQSHGLAILAPRPFGPNFVKRLAALSILFASPLFCQSNRGELHLTVIDPAGLGVKTTVQIISEANQYRNTLQRPHSG
jgi:hypothetical protein